MADLTANPPRGVLNATRGHAPSRGSLPGATRPGALNLVLPADRVPPRMTAAQVEEEEWDDGPAADPIFGTTPASAALAGFNAAQERPFAAARMGLFVGGGILSLALVGLIGVWGYKVVLREVLGVPVVAAEAGPMRLVPEDPGGSITADGGLAVNAVAADGTAAPPSDVLTLAPATADLAPEDMEVAQTDAEADELLPAAAAPAAVEAAATAIAAAAPVVAAAATTTLLPPPAQAGAADAPMAPADVLALADAISAGVAPLTPLAEGQDAPVETAVVAPDDVAATLPADVPGVAVAYRPPSRPSGRVTDVQLTSAPAAPEPAAPVEAEPVAASAPADIPPGTSLAQLGAFDSAEIAAGEWERLQGPFGEFLAGKTRVIQEAESGGRTFFRLRAMGFEDLADARRFCAALVAEDAGCITVVTQ